MLSQLEGEEHWGSPALCPLLNYSKLFAVNYAGGSLKICFHYLLLNSAMVNVTVLTLKFYPS